MKNIFDKLDLGMKFFIIAIFGIAVIYCILSSVFGLFQDEKKEEKIDIDNINKYIMIYSEGTGEESLDTTKIVKDYSMFYTIESAIQNYIGSLMSEDYSKTYNVLSDEIKEKYSKKQYVEKIKEFTTSNFISNESTYELDHCLKRAYNIESYAYLCECKTIKDESINIGVRLDAYTNTYTIFYIDFD